MNMEALACVGEHCSSEAMRSLLQDGDGSTIVGWEGWVTLAILFVGLVILFKDWLRTEFVMMGMLLAMIWFKIIDVKTGLEGFSSASILTVMILYGVAEGISQTGALDSFFQKVLGRPTNCPAAIIRMCLPVCFWSSFLNNTPVVALMIPILVTWSRVIKLPVSKFMIPLSYVSELGGVCTLIGTSTNLVVKEKYDKALDADPSLPTLTIFSQSRFGIPIALMGIVYIALFGHFILPGSSEVGGARAAKAKKAAKGEEEEEPIQVGMVVTSNSPAIGRTLADVGLADMPDLKVTRIEREGVSLPVYDLGNRVINMYDELYISGDMALVDELAAQLQLVIVTDEYDHDPFAQPKRHQRSDDPNAPTRGLLLDDPSVDRTSPRTAAPRLQQTSIVPELSANSAVGTVRLVHVTVKDGAPIVGTSIKQVRFRTRFNAAVVDVRRQFKRVPGNLGDVVLSVGDDLLLDVGNNFDSAAADLVENFEDITHVKAPAKQFMMALQVVEGSPLAGKTLQEAGLRGMGNAFVSTIERGEKQLHAVSPNVTLESGDILWIAGSSEAMSQLRSKKGLRAHGPQASTLNVSLYHRELIQAALSSSSPLIGRLVSEANFEQYNVSLIAVHRSGERLSSLKGVRFQTGDGLLLEGSREFVKQYADNEGFVLLSVLENSSPTKWNRSMLALFLLIALIIAQVAQNAIMDKPWIEFLPLCGAVCALMLLTRCMTPSQLHKALKWDVYLTIAVAIGISNALEDSGVAAMIADGIVSVGQKLGGDIFIIAAMYITTALLSNIIANNAAAALLFPIMLNISKQKGIELELLAYTLMFGASSAFMTPYGYQTNLMVQDIGGYRSIDYLKFGGPLQLWQAVVTIAILAVADHWYVTWIVVAIICAIVFTPALASDTAVYRKLRHHAVGKKVDDLELKGPPHAAAAPTHV